MPGIKLNLTETEKRIKAEEKINKKLIFLRKDFMANKINSFAQIEAFIPFTILASRLHIPYNSLKNKVKSPGDFTNNELVRLAEIIDIDFLYINRFILSVMQLKFNISFFL
jgi:hypothetical protein